MYMRYRKGAGSAATKKRNKLMLRLIPYILVMILVLFLFVVKLQADVHYRHIVSNQRWTLSELEDEYADSDFRLAMMVLLLDAHCYYDREHTMPTAIGVYSLDSNLIWRSGAMISTIQNGNSTWVEMEKYLNDEKKNEMQKWFDQNYFDPAIHELQYIESPATGEYVPVSMDLGQFVPYDDNTGYLTESSGITIDFRDTNGLSDSDYESLQVLRDINAVPYFIDDGPKSSNYKIYQDLYAEITDQREICTIYPPNGVKSTSISGIGFAERIGRYYYSMFCTGEVSLNINGEKTPCFIYMTSKVDLIKSALLDADFRKTMAIIAAAVAILYAGIALYYSRKTNLDLEEAKRTFVSASAHELKTPLAVIQNQAEMVLEDINPEKNKEYVASIYEEAERMKGIILSMQRYDRLTNMDKVEMTVFDLSELVSEELTKYRNAFNMREIDLDVDLVQGAAIKGDRELIAMVVDNFLSNAAKYATAPESGKPRVIVSVTPKGSKRRFSVFNTCEEIAGDEMAKAWDLMYKIDKSRNREESKPSASEGQDQERNKNVIPGGNDLSTDGGGMGLPLAGRILEFHKYKYGSHNIGIEWKGEKLNGVEFWFMA